MREKREKEPEYSRKGREKEQQREKERRGKALGHHIMPMHYKSQHTLYNWEWGSYLYAYSVTNF